MFTATEESCLDTEHPEVEQLAAMLARSSPQLAFKIQSPVRDYVLRKLAGRHSSGPRRSLWLTRAAALTEQRQRSFLRTRWGHFR
eukprot:5046142-Amphidinium_carterae.2